MTTNHQWLLKSRPRGRVSVDNFTWNEAPLPPLNDGDVLVRNRLLSLDPAMRGWMAGDGYRSAVKLGSVMDGSAVATVVESRSDRFEAGALVQTMMGWQAYAVIPARRLTPLPALPGVPLDAYMGLLSHIGLTAYFGLMDIGQPKPGETLVVSAAAGAVGSLVGQIGKIQGCRVVGIAGSAEKCAWLTDDLGFDAAINYKTENVYRSLKTHCPDGIDINFENVGGEIMDAILGQMNNFGRIPLCGLISQYNATERVPGPYNFGAILTKRLTVRGFIVTDFIDRAMEAMQALAQWHLAGKLHYRTHIVDGLENAPDALNMLFDGQNEGKLAVRVSSDD